MSRNEEVTALQENEMGTLPVGKLLRKMALPLIFFHVCAGTVRSGRQYVCGTAW